MATVRSFVQGGMLALVLAAGSARAASVLQYLTSLEAKFDASSRHVVEMSVNKGSGNAVYDVVATNAAFQTGDKATTLPPGYSADWLHSEGSVQVNGVFPAALVANWYVVVTHHISIGVDGTDFRVTVPMKAQQGTYPYRETVRVDHVGSGHKVTVTNLSNLGNYAELAGPGTIFFEKINSLDVGYVYAVPDSVFVQGAEPTTLVSQVEAISKLSRLKDSREIAGVIATIEREAADFHAAAARLKAMKAK